MKRVLIVAVLCMSVVSLVGCGGSSSTPAKGGTGTGAPAAPTAKK